MASPPFLFLFLFLFAHLSLVSASDSKDNHTLLFFYMHEIPTGPSATVVRIAEAATKTNSPAAGFGAMVMMDDFLTEGPDPNSKLIGRAQGMYAAASQREDAPAMLMTMNLAFVDGDYKGSTIAVFGRMAMPSRLRVTEMPVIGGTGQFRFARGYALSIIYHHDHTTGNTIYRYNVFVKHDSTYHP